MFCNFCLYVLKRTMAVRQSASVLLSDLAHKHSGARRRNDMGASGGPKMEVKANMIRGGSSKRLILVQRSNGKEFSDNGKDAVKFCVR